MHKITPKRRQIIFGLVAVIIFTTFWSLKSRGAVKQPSIPTQAVRTTLVQESGGSIPLEISGFVREENRADISPSVSGKILRIFKHEGDLVKKGEILVTIDAENSTAQVNAAKANVAALEKTLDDSKQYYDQLVDQAKESSDDEAIKSAKRARDLQIQATKDQLIAAQGYLKIAQSDENNFTITAPFSGTITTVNVREGDFANFSSPLMRIGTQDNLEIETYITPADARNISIGSLVQLQAPDGTFVTGKVVNISAGSDSFTLKTLVRIRLEDKSETVRIGDFLHGKIMLTRKQQAASIPRDAIVLRGGDEVVFILEDNNTVREQPVKTGSEYDGMVDIIEGLNVNQKIVTEGQQYLINGITATPYETR